ncbi:cell wall metabolism sensor histidine kinase WalK, partial [Candidatus Gracilibacteria bacterium]|nr:cell wall metabolism sensor histidine kinase WalK [Candidatus Gracilibacteria bacterium]
SYWLPTAYEFAALADQVPQRALLPGDVAVRLFSAGGALLGASDDLGPFPSRAARVFIRSPLPLPVSQVEVRRYTAAPIGTSPLLGVVELSRSTVAERDLLAELQRFGLQAALLAAAVMALISWLVARSIARPIGALSAHAATLARNEGQADIAQPFGGRGDEIGLLARSLEQLAHELRGQIASSEQERRQLAAVLGAISEGVLAVDAHGRLIYANAAAERMLGSAFRIQDVEDVVRDTTHLARLLMLEERGEREVQHDGKTLLVTNFPIAGDGTAAQLPTAVVVVRDVTQLRALEMARSRLLRSVSHELRTPLTAILGTVENLRDEAGQPNCPRLPGSKTNRSACAA